MMENVISNKKKFKSGSTYLMGISTEKHKWDQEVNSAFSQTVFKGLISRLSVGTSPGILWTRRQILPGARGASPSLSALSPCLLLPTCLLRYCLFQRPGTGFPTSGPELPASPLPSGRRYPGVRNQGARGHPVCLGSWPASLASLATARPSQSRLGRSQPQ